MLRAVVTLAGTALGVGAVLSYQPSSAADDPVSADTGPTAVTPSGTLPTTSDATSSAPGPAAQWVEGDVVAVKWGNVQVKAQLQGTTILDVQTLSMPDADAYSADLSTKVATTLRTEVLQAQSADVDMISGATYSSQAYLTSLQSALDKARSAAATAPVVSVTPTDTAAAAQWVEGDVVAVKWGNVQVKAQLQGTTILDVQTLSMPDADAYSADLSTKVATTLRTEVLQAQSADVDMISGATYSSQAYLTSLQSALDKQ